MEPVPGTTPRATSDRELVLTFQAGDPAAYDEMYRRYHRRVFSVCSRILNNSQDAEEASQETFLRAYQALPRFNGNFRLGAWLARIAANTSVDQLRSKARSPLVGLPSEEPEAADELDPEEVVTGGDPRLEIALGDIKPVHARALAWRNVEGLSHQEIAGKLEMSPAQVKALLHRARLSLRKAWDRAEGWALAPLIAGRSFFSSRSNGSPGSPLLGAAPTFTPVLAERVATTALAVAVALTGLPTATGSSGSSENVERNERGFAWGEASTAALPKKKALPSTKLPVKQPTTAPEDPVGAAVREIQGVLSGHDRFDDKPKKRDQSSEDVPSATAASTTRKLLKEVRDILPGAGPVDLNL
ncbi:MAG TPA: RNA polymerase sigma factor [Actinomycetota bacterium]|nr:RNA polymerase sigma factor [Actinomycetota bacterium]